MHPKHSEFFRQHVDNNNINLPNKIESFSDQVQEISDNLNGVHRNAAKRKNYKVGVDLTDDGTIKTINNKEELKRVERQITFHSDLIKRLLDHDTSRHYVAKEYLKGELNEYGIKRKKSNLMKNMKTTNTTHSDFKPSSNTDGLFLTSTNNQFKTDSCKSITTKTNNSFSKNASSFKLNNSIYPKKGPFPLVTKLQIDSKLNSGKSKFYALTNRIKADTTYYKTKTDNPFFVKKPTLLLKKNQTLNNKSVSNKILITDNSDSYYYNNKILRRETEKYYGANETYFNTEPAQSPILKLYNQSIPTRKETESSLRDNITTEEMKASSDTKQKAKSKLDNKKRGERLIKICRAQAYIDGKIYSRLEKAIEVMHPEVPFENKLTKEKIDEHNNIRPDKRANRYFIYGKAGGNFVDYDSNIENLIAFSNSLEKMSPLEIFKFKDIFSEKMGLKISSGKTDEFEYMATTNPYFDDPAFKRAAIKQTKRHTKVEKFVYGIEKSHYDLIKKINDYLTKH